MESRIKLDTALDLKGNFLFGKILIFSLLLFFSFLARGSFSKKTLSFSQTKKNSPSAAVSPCCIGCARALKTTNLLPRLGAASACVALALALVPWGLGASLRQLDGAVAGASAGSRVMAAALCLALWCAAQCAAALAHAVGAAVTFAESYECCRFGAEAGRGGSSTTTTSAVGRPQQQQQPTSRSKLSSALISLAAGPKWRGAIGGGATDKPAAKEKESSEIATQTEGGAVFSVAASSSSTATAN